MASVVDTITLMIKAFPAINTSRLNALYHIFMCSSVSWVNGELVFDEENRTMYSEYAAKPNDEENYDAVATICNVADDILFKNKNISDDNFIRNNAHYLAECDEFSCFNRLTVAPRHLSGVNFYSMPDNVSEDWKSAALELLQAIMDYKISDREVYVKEIEEGKMLAEQLIDRMNPEKAKSIRANNIFKLMNMAKKMGIEITVKD